MTDDRRGQRCAMPGKVAKAPVRTAEGVLQAVRRRGAAGDTDELLARDLDPGARRGFRGLWLGSLGFRGWECGSGRTRLGLGTGCGSGRCLGRAAAASGLGSDSSMAGAGVACGSIAVAWVTGAGVWAADGGGGSAVVLGVACESMAATAGAFGAGGSAGASGTTADSGNDRRGGRDRCDRGFRLRWFGCILGGFGLGRRVKRAFPGERHRAARSKAAAPS